MADNPSTFGPSTFSNLGGAVSDLFAGLGATTAANLKAQGLDIEAAGTRISAQSLLLQSQGDLAEASEYDLAQALATQNANYVKASTAIQAAQQDRATTMTIGSQRAAVGGGGLAESGSALDLLRDSASQGALARSVLVTQGSMQEQGYEEQANSYGVMSAAARATAAGEVTISGETRAIAAQQDQLASETQAAGKQAAAGDFVSAALKGVAAVASIAAAPATGGASLLALGAISQIGSLGSQS
jgi:hypothetical protein